MLRPSFRLTDGPPACRRSAGFTLIELVMVVAILAVLVSLGLATYRVYVLKAEAAQILVNYDHIRTVVAIKTRADEATSLEQDSVPGAVPPALVDALDTREFNGPDGLTFQFVRAPAGTFASFPKDDVYALIATAGNAAAVLRLRVLRAVLPFVDGDKVWVQAAVTAPEAQLIYPIDIGLALSAPGGSNTGGGGETGGGSTGGGQTPPATTPPVTTLPAPTPPATTPPATTPPGSGGSSITGEGTGDGNTWNAGAHVCIGSASGGPLTGQNNTSVILQVVTQYANFQVNLKIDPATGCADYSYNGLPLSSDAQISVVQVVDYNPPNSGGTSALWDGVKPSVTIKP